MDLPGLPMDQWRNITATKEPPSELKTQRTSAGTLARYYPDYVRLMGLEEHFVENTVVTSVRQLHADVEENVKMEPIPEQEAPLEHIGRLFIGSPVLAPTLPALTL